MLSNFVFWRATRKSARNCALNTKFSKSQVLEHLFSLVFSSVAAFTECPSAEIVQMKQNEQQKLIQTIQTETITDERPLLQEGLSV